MLPILGGRCANGEGPLPCRWERGLSSRSRKPTQASAHASSMPATLGSRRGRNSPRDRVGQGEGVAAEHVDVLEAQGREPGDVFGPNLVSFGAELAERRIHVDRVPEHDEAAPFERVEGDGKTMIDATGLVGSEGERSSSMPSITGQAVGAGPLAPGQRWSLARKHEVAAPAAG